MLKDDDVQAVHKLNEAYRKITHELGKVIVGQQDVIEQLMICLFAQGHCLLVCVPGDGGPGPSPSPAPSPTPSPGPTPSPSPAPQNH